MGYDDKQHRTPHAAGADARDDAEKQHERKHLGTARDAISEIAAIRDDMHLRHRHCDAARKATLVRVNKTAVGIVFPAVFSLLRTSRMAFTASVASSRLPCVGTDEISPADRVADHQGRGSLED